MSRKILLSVATATVLLFTGCAKDGMALNTVDGNKVARAFKEGSVVSQQKVIIDEGMTATLSGVGVGALGGAVAGGDVKGAAIGAVVGGLLGAVIGKEVEAYETELYSEKEFGETYTAYLKQKLPIGTIVEFTVKDKKIKNVNVIKIGNGTGASLQKSKIAKKVAAVQTSDLSGVVVAREQAGNLWTYAIWEEKTGQKYILKSANFYPYYRDEVTLKYTKNDEVVEMNLVAREQMEKYYQATQTLPPMVEKKENVVVPAVKKSELVKEPKEEVKQKTETPKIVF